MITMCEVPKDKMTPAKPKQMFCWCLFEHPLESSMYSIGELKVKVIYEVQVTNKVSLHYEKSAQ